MSTTAKQTRRPAAKRPHRVGLRKPVPGPVPHETAEQRRARMQEHINRVFGAHANLMARLAADK